MFAVPPNTVALVSPAAFAHPALVAAEFARDRDRWRGLLRYDPDRRFAALVELTEDQEVWLMGWLPGQGTELHDHADTTAAFTVVSGTLTEQVAYPGHREDVVHNLVAGQSRVFAAGYVHRIHNAGPDPAVSIHVHRVTGPTGGSRRVDRLTGIELR